MAAKSQWVDVDNRRLELSNLEKVLFPEDEISKAEVIEYYLNMSSVILYHIKGRPLTLIRYPDGIHAQRFYQKNTPDWAPDWVESIALGSEEKKDYVLANEPASLVWLANLAALELHQMNVRLPNFERPDYMVFDLDPPEDGDFTTVTDMAFRLKEHIEQYGYHTFVKTTGGKGLHLLVPLLPQEEVRTVFETSKEIAQDFVENNPADTTLHIKKTARKGRILIDIYRNRSGQTIVSPYSLRGRAGAPVSMPVRWDELQEIGNSSHYDLKNSWQKIDSEGDAWEGIGGYAVPLHTHRNLQNLSAELPDSPRRKTADQLADYSKKRDFSRTTEPGGGMPAGEGSSFVVHRHHATRLHYDLRLEQDGTLKSWAVPKGMPPRPGVKRLAIQTEDHPMEYLTFEGTIPKGEYGGGEMWVYASGKYTITKQKENGFYFRLDSPALSGEYRMHNTKENEWLLERTDSPRKDWLNDPIDPMHGISVEKPPKGDYMYEIKWDGIRAIISLEDGNIRIRSRNRNDITDKFPELQQPGALRATCGLFDGEIVFLDEHGRPSFEDVINRLKSSGESTIKKLSEKKPVYCYLFDCLYLDGRSLVNEPFTRRYEWLTDVVKKGHRYRLSEAIDDGDGLFKAVQQYKMEGIMAKKKAGKYVIGKRTDLWQKVKVRHSEDCLVIGYTKGQGGRSANFGALHVAEKSNGELIYRGKVGTGFDDQMMREIYEELKGLDPVKKPSYKNLPDDKNSVWVEPGLFVEVSYGRLSGNGLYKEAVFIRTRPDLAH